MCQLYDTQAVLGVANVYVDAVLLYKDKSSHVDKSDDAL